MVTCDAQVMIRPTEVVGPNLVNSRFATIGAGLSVQLLDKLRKYLTFVRFMPFEVSEETQHAVENDFVEERRAHGHAAMTANDLHSMLVLGRLMSLSLGHKTLTANTWQRVKQMEKERKERVAHLPPRQMVPPAQANNPQNGNH